MILIPPPTGTRPLDDHSVYATYSLIAVVLPEKRKMLMRKIAEILLLSTAEQCDFGGWNSDY